MAWRTGALLAARQVTAKTRLTSWDYPNPSNDPFIANFARSMGFSYVYKNQESRINKSGITTAEQNFTKVHGRHELQFGGNFPV